MTKHAKIRHIAGQNEPYLSVFLVENDLRGARIKLRASLLNARRVGHIQKTRVDFIERFCQDHKRYAEQCLHILFANHKE